MFCSSTGISSDCSNIDCSSTGISSDSGVTPIAITIVIGHSFPNHLFIKRKEASLTIKILSSNNLCTFFFIRELNNQNFPIISNQAQLFEPLLPPTPRPTPSQQEVKINITPESSTTHLSISQHTTICFH